MAKMLTVKTDAGAYTVKVHNNVEAAQFLRTLAKLGFKCLKWEVKKFVS